jgi:hypothetical protein
MLRLHAKDDKAVIGTRPYLFFDQMVEFQAPHFCHAWNATTAIENRLTGTAPARN